MPRRGYKRWQGFPADMPLDLTDPGALAEYLRELARKVDDFARENNAVWGDSTDVIQRFRTEYPLGSGVSAGMLVYYNGEEMKPASLDAIAHRPMAVVDETLGGSRGYCWFGGGETWIATADTWVSPGAWLYLSSSDGLCTTDPPAIDGSTVMYRGEIGMAVGRIKNGLVPAVFRPGMQVLVV